jgi:hypothetical protein
MKRKIVAKTSCTLALCFVVSVIPGNAQKADAYIHDMAQALLPSGSIQAPTCHNVEIHPGSILTRFALASGQNEKGEVTWNIYAVDALWFSLDMSDINEDKIMNNMERSLSSLSHHQPGTPYPDPDLPVVVIPATGPKKITVHAVDLDKLDNLPRGNNLSESEMGTKIEQRTAVLVSFPDKDHADAFVNALKKAIIACKAQ